ncbi:19886_t:CDS:2 [Gigaspora margarita]|uniref:19886_t:CDS:1 n=1 Tax=Gigaspora margarita TaxID=4874 RepID=A0ABN7UNT1_GIGMA|nr:19886_t:CDS:2 [Gigaspora margarita]
MSLQAKEPDKLLAKVAYRSFAILRPLDNSIRAIYNMKPDNNNEALMAWKYNETALKDTRSLLEEVFGEELEQNLNQHTLKVIPVLAKCKGAITGHITEHKIRETGFGAATIMEVAQPKIIQQQINKRLYTCGKKTYNLPLIYLDNILLLAHSKQEAIEQTQTIIQLLENLEFKNQCAKVQSNTNSANRISGFQDQHYRNESKSPNKENQRDKKGMFYKFKEASNTYKKVSITYWKAFSHYWCNISSKTKNIIPDKRQKLNYKIP